MVGTVQDRSGQPKVSRKEAIALGLKHYWRHPCKRCASQWFVVSSHGCVSCNRVRATSNPNYVKYLEYLKTPKGIAEQLCRNAKYRAKSKNLEFDLKPTDFEVPQVCPLLGIEIAASRNGVQDWSPTLDRLDNTKGYVKGNVWVISFKANTLKSNASLEELELLCENLRNKLA